MPLPEINTPQAGENEQDALDSNKTMELSAAELAAVHAHAPPPSFASVKTAAAQAAIATAAQAAPAQAAASPLTFSQAAPVEVKDPVQSGDADSARGAFGAGFHAKRRRTWLAGLLCVAAAVPLAGMLASRLTAPPRVPGVPTGHLITLQADPSSAALPGLFVAGPGGASRLLARDEPQAGGTGRVQITQPALSPDGTQLAFEKQLTTVQNGTSSADNQIWVMPMTPDTTSPPHLVLDLTRQHLKQIAGLAWDSDSSLMFLEDGASYSVATDTDDAPLVTPLALHGLTLATTTTVSATRSPVLTESGTFAYTVQTPSGPQVLTQSRERTTPGPAAAVFALSPSGDVVAFVPPGDTHVIRRYDLAHQCTLADLPVHWRWSLFDHRQITSLRWSPDGSQIACTVSKAPAPENEIFLVTPATGQTVQLPYRTLPDAWDWGK